MKKLFRMIFVFRILKKEMMDMWIIVEGTVTG